MKKLGLRTLCFIALVLVNCKSYRLSDINHIIHMGQSLGAGEQSLPIITDTITGYGNLKFSTGTHTWSGAYHPESPELRSSSNFNFVPLIANRRHGEGETIANGMCDHFIATSNFKGKLLFSYAGRGDRYLRELNKRHDEANDYRAGDRQSKGGHYKTSIDDVKRAKLKADSLKLTYDVLAITWMQGETNNNLKISTWDKPFPRDKFLNTYKNDLIELKNDYDEDISEILGFKVNLPFFTYQTGGTNSAMAQLMATDENDRMFMVGPTYMMPNAENTTYNQGGKIQHGDGIHLTADAERWLGEQFGKVMRRVLLEDEQWQPLRPIKASYSADKGDIYVEFHVPRPPLILDTLLLPKQESYYGFSLRDKEQNIIPIKGLTLLNDSTIKISLGKLIKEEMFLSYADNSYVKDISNPIFKIYESGLNQYGFNQISIEFQGNIVDEFSKLLDEGVFYLENEVENLAEQTNLIVREVKLNDDGNTVLSGELDDLKSGIPFKTGQNCYVSRRFRFGNLRDSDNEKSIFKFSDTTYGKRGHMPYPLYNWCVSFKEFKIVNKKY